MESNFILKGFLMPENTSSNDSDNEIYRDELPYSEAQLLGAFEENALSLRDAEESIRPITIREIKNGKPE